MSELTRCNHCTLEEMQERARRRGVTVVIKIENDGDMSGWTSARYSDKYEPSAYFIELTDHCVC